MKIKQTRNTLSDTYLDAMKIRQEVFVKGQGVPLSLEIDDITLYIDKEPWIKDIAAVPSFERNTQMIERVVEEFIHKYWLMEKEEITTKNVADVLLVADPLSRRHLLAQRVVIKSIGLLKTEDKIRLLDKLRFLDKIMDELATNPNLKA